jgi:energy-coupling factor transporter ATP-binding protein EcfA2
LELLVKVKTGKIINSLLIAFILLWLVGIGENTMRMKRFRVQNYKNVSDTDWVDCGDLTAFVGKNEAGKSAIFRGLSKLNPSDGEKYDGLKEFPRRRYTVDFKGFDWPVSSVEFQLSEDECKQLKEICPVLDKVKDVVCTRYYSWDLETEFEPKPSLPDISCKRYLGLLKKWHSAIEKVTAPEGKGDQFSPIKQSLLQFLTQKAQKVGESDPNSVVDRAFVDDVSNTIMGKITEEWQKQVFEQIAEEIGGFKNDIEVVGQFDKATKWIESNLPIFVYFYEYDVIDSAVHFPTFVQQLKQTPSAPRVRTTKCLFEHVGLDIETIQKLDPATPNQSIETLRKFADERAILMSSASNAMTEKFSEWWEQRKHKFAYKTDGHFFRIWVSDDLDPSEIELDQRSYGMQYFFSFYLVFLEEAKGAHANAILLLDEPGLHLHGTAQQKIVEFLEKLSKQNQLLYSTHSPFMVDPDHLERVRVVYEDENGNAKVSEDVWPKDEDSLFPLQAGLGYALAQTLFYSKRQVVVEGLSDYWLLKAINDLLSRKNMKALREDAVIVPCGGVSKLLPLASMLRGHEVKLAIVLDGDEPGRQKGKEVQTRLLLKCLFLSDFAKREEAEIEDLFPEKLYLDAVYKAYPEIKVPLEFNQEEKNIQCISKRVKAMFERNSFDFDKWRPARVILDWIQEKPDMVPNETLVKFESIFDEVNRILK